MRHAFPLAAAALLAATPLAAQDKAAGVDKIFSWVTPGMPGCAVGISQNGKAVLTRGYGLADLEHPAPITPNTVFDAGSLVKQFVAASVLMLVEDGTIALSEDIHKYLPDMAPLPNKVTVAHLLSHVSGIREWSGMLGLADGNVDILTLIKRQRGLDFVPGAEFYSNSNYELLKAMVAQVSGKTFAEFTNTRIFKPLGMNSSRYLLDLSVVVKDRAIPYARTDSSWRQDVNAGVTRGRGALFTTAADLLIWSDAVTTGKLGKFVTEELQKTTVLNNGRPINYARGLTIDNYLGTRRVMHSGAAGGYSSFLGALPEQGLAVSLMCNVDEGAKGAYIAGILDLYLPAGFGKDAPSAASSVPASRGAPITGVDVSSRVGLFFNEANGQVLRLVSANGNLGVQGVGPLVTIANDRFRNNRGTLQFMSQAEFELKFVSADNFVIMTTDGDTTRYRRARTFVPTVAELQTYAGRFESTELGAILDVVPDQGALLVRVATNPEQPLKFVPTERDAFMLSNVQLRFTRDRAGKISGFTYSNPVVRNISFAKAAR